MGTYDLIEYTAIGTAVNLGARLESVGHVDSESQRSFPCVSRQTHDEAGDRFVYLPGNPREEDLKGFGRQQVWDVVGRKKR
jgi:class 3 adenylate cyclase